MQHGLKFKKLSQFTFEYVANERIKKTLFENRLAYYIRHQLVGQNVNTFEELYDKATRVVRIKGELCEAISTNNKRKGGK